ncbi:unnamed protein product [Sphagnum troendelagicum]|uniref:Uncharacterized protein n=1 Tax=Sphagnum troendelagicum TaxID=128251 RepID=A0ABP0UQE3_9BRYO
MEGGSSSSSSASMQRRRGYYEPPSPHWPNQHEHPDDHLHPLPHPYPQQDADQWQASSQQLPPSASDVHQPPQQPLVRGSLGSHHPGAQLEKPSGGAGSYALQHTGREPHQAFRMLIWDLQLKVVKSHLALLLHL